MGSNNSQLHSNHSQATQQKKQSKDYVLLALLAFFMIVLLSLFFTPKKEGVGHHSNQTQELDTAQAFVSDTSDKESQIINQHLQEVHRDLELARMTVEVENAEMAPELRENHLSYRVDDAYRGERLLGLKMEQEDTADRVYRDLARPDGGRKHWSPDETINDRLALRQWVNEYDQKLQQYYIEQFLQNARDAGYEVELNQELEVVRVRNVPTERRWRGPQSLGSK